MDCFQDCCLYCDRDSPDGAYCSQQCKLADHSSASSSSSSDTESSPTTPGLSQWISSQTLHDTGYSRTAYFSSTGLERLSSNERQLSQSSSRTSLSSTMSTSPSASADASASRAKQDLQGYFSSFDQARAAKRRSSTR